MRPPPNTKVSPKRSATRRRAIFGPNATQQDNAPAFTADQSKSYVTANADPAGNRVYTDAYQFGPAVVIVYVIANDAEAAGDIRTEVAETVSARMG